MFPLLYNHEGISKVLKEIAKSNTKQWFFITQIVKFSTFDVYFFGYSLSKVAAECEIKCFSFNNFKRQLPEKKINIKYSQIEYRKILEYSNRERNFIK